MRTLLGVSGPGGGGGGGGGATFAFAGVGAAYIIVRLGLIGGGGGGGIEALKSFSVTYLGFAANSALREAISADSLEISSSFWERRSMVRVAMT